MTALSSRGLICCRHHRIQNKSQCNLGNPSIRILRHLRRQIHPDSGRSLSARQRKEHCYRLSPHSSDSTLCGSSENRSIIHSSQLTEQPRHPSNRERWSLGNVSVLFTLLHPIRQREATTPSVPIGQLYVDRRLVESRSPVCIPSHS